MRTLALETSGMAGSLAALDASRVLEERTLDPAQKAARTLAPSIRELLRGVGWRPADVQLVAVAAGPGSFTGLRIGVTTAKAFAYAVGAQVLGVNTLEAVAFAVPPEAFPLRVVMDAQRRELFAATFARDEQGRVTFAAPTHIVAADDWLAGLRPGESVAGPGLERLAAALPPGVIALPRELWHPRAAAVGQLALEHHAAGRRDDVFQLTPNYFRKSAAEEKRMAAP
jgi:tRNA threonylcarbamoyladenosine biosynthesis protein TsaB